MELSWVVAGERERVRSFVMWKGNENRVAEADYMVLWRAGEGWINE